MVLGKRKTAGLTAVFHMLISISRILSPWDNNTRACSYFDLYNKNQNYYLLRYSYPTGDDHLSGSAITRTLERHPALARSTALHSGKDLAVSPRMLPCRLTHMGCFFLSSEASLLAPLKLLSTGVTRYPAAQLSLGECSDFPPLLAQGRPSDMGKDIVQLF